MNGYCRLRTYAWWAMLAGMLVMAFRAGAIPDSVQYLHYSIDNGLPSNHVYCCMQDKEGYLWLATDNGVVKYNGYTQKIYNAYTGLPENDFYWIQEGPEGRMWLYGVTKHFGYLEADQYHDILQEKVGFGAAVPFYGKMLIRGTSAFYLADTAVIGRVAFPRGWSGAGIGGDGKLYCADRANRLFAFDPVARSVRMWNGDTACIAGAARLASVKNMDDLWSDSFIIRVQKGGRFIGKIGLNSEQCRYADIAALGASDGEYVYTSYAYSGNLVMVTTNRQVLLLDGQLELRGRKSFPSGGQVSFWYRDRIGNEWFTTTAEGVICRLHTVNLIRRAPFAGKMYDSRMVGVSDRYSYWWHNANDMLYQVDMAGEAREWALGDRGRLESAAVWEDSLLLLSFRNSGCMLLDTRTGKLTDFKQVLGYTGTGTPADTAIMHYSRELNELSWAKVLTRYKNKCIALSFDKLVVFSDSGKDLQAKMLNTDFCTKLTFDSLQRKYILYTFDRLVVYDPETDSMYRFNEIKNYIPELKQVLQVYTDRFSNIYFLCTKGLLSYNLSTSRWCRMRTGFNLTGASIGVYKDRLIIFGNFGVAAAAITGPGTIGPFYISSNVQNSYYRHIINAWISADGIAMARTDRGWITVNVDDLLQKGFKAGTRNVGSFSLLLNAPYRTAVHSGDTIRLAAGTNKLVLDVINFYGGGTVRYQYRTNNGWQQSLSGEIFPENVPPGVYYPLQLHVSDDSWQSNTITLYLYVKPYWWQRQSWHTVFWVGGGLLLIVLVLLTVYITRSVVEKANEKKRMLTDLELRAIHAQINPHFIFNTLSTALYFISRKEYDNAYGHVNKFSHLLRSYLKSSHDRYVLLSEEIDMLKRYVDLQQTRFEEKFDFELSIDNKIPVNNIQIPSLLLQPLVENAINHGLFHKKEKGLLKLGFGQGDTPDSIIVIIDDNGVGRAESTRIRQASMTDRESYGGRLTQKLMDIFRRYEAMDIEIQYIDKEQPETGTIVRLTIGNIRYIV